MENDEVNIEGVGKFVLRKPKSGPFNDSMIACTNDSGTLNQVKLIFDLLPKCIKEHPFKVKLEDGLRDLEIEEQELLISKVTSYIKLNKKGDLRKKPEQPSEQSMTQS